MRTRDRFLSIIETISGCDESMASKVADFYLENRIAKIDVVNGNLTFEHGIFLEPDVIQNAINKITQAEAK